MGVLPVDRALCLLCECVYMRVRVYAWYLICRWCGIDRFKYHAYKFTTRAFLFVYKGVFICVYVLTYHAIWMVVIWLLYLCMLEHGCERA
jgi:hypothetical protein